MNFLLQVDVTPEMLPDPNLFESALRIYGELGEVGIFLYPILILGIVAIYGFRKKTREPEKVMFRYGIFIFIFGTFQTALFAHTVATFEAWGITTPPHPTCLVDEGIEVFCMYTGLSLITVFVSLLPIWSQPVGAGQPANPPVKL